MSVAEELRHRARLALLRARRGKTTDVNPRVRSVSVEKASWWSQRLGVPVAPGTPTAALPKTAEIDDVLSLEPRQREAYLRLRQAGGSHERAMRDARSLGDGDTPTPAEATPAKKAAPVKAPPLPPLSPDAQAVRRVYWDALTEMRAAGDDASARRLRQVFDDYADGRIRWSGFVKRLRGMEHPAARRVYDEIASRMAARKAAPAKAAPRKATAPSAEQRQRQAREWARRYERGESISQIAVSEGVSYSTVHSRLTKDAGIQLRPRGSRPVKATPAKKATAPAARPTAPEGMVRRPFPPSATDARSRVEHLRSIDTVEQAQDAVADLGRGELLEMARELSVPGAGRLNVEELRREVVFATVGRRLESIATRGFAGRSPSDPGESADEFFERTRREAGLPPMRADQVVSTLRQRGLDDLTPTQRQAVSGLSAEQRRVYEARRDAGISHDLALRDARQVAPRARGEESARDVRDRLERQWGYRPSASQVLRRVSDDELRRLLFDDRERESLGISVNDISQEQSSRSAGAQQLRDFGVEAFDPAREGAPRPTGRGERGSVVQFPRRTTPATAGSGGGEVTDLSDYRRALAQGLSPRDAAAYAAWLRRNPGGSIAQWQAQRQRPAGTPSLDSLRAMQTREQVREALAGLRKSQLQALARELSVPRASSLTVRDLIAEIVQATVGRRIESLAIRGFEGDRP